MQKWLLTILMVFAIPVQAIDIDSLDLKSLLAPGNAQTQFNSLMKGFANVSAYRAVKAPRPMGALVGVDVGLDLSNTDLAEVNTVLTDLGEAIVASLPVPKAHAHVTLPLGIGLSAFAAPEVEGVGLQGAALNYAFINGDIGFIVEAVYTLSGGVHTTSMNVDNVFDMSSVGGDVTVLLGIDLPLLKINPYAGIGFDQVSATPKFSTEGLDVSATDFSQTRLFAGVEVKLALFILSVEMDQIGDTSTTSGKIGMGFGF